MATSATTPERQRRLGDSRMPSGTASDAAALGLDVAGLDDQAIAAAVKAERDRRWREENREALESWNVWIEKNGLPLERYRLF